MCKSFLFHLGNSEPNEQDNFCCAHFLREKGLNADHLDYPKRIHKSNATNMVLEIIIFAILLKMQNSRSQLDADKSRENTQAGTRSQTPGIK